MNINDFNYILFRDPSDKVKKGPNLLGLHQVILPVREINKSITDKEFLIWDDEINTKEILWNIRVRINPANFLIREVSDWDEIFQLKLEMFEKSDTRKSKIGVITKHFLGNLLKPEPSRILFEYLTASEYFTESIVDYLNLDYLGDFPKDIFTDEYLKAQKARIGQEKFRQIILSAYDSCVICGLKNNLLLEAAHIVSWKDNEEKRGSLNNGLALCRICHRLFDSNLIGINEDYSIWLNQDFFSVVEDHPIIDVIKIIDIHIV